MFKKKALRQVEKELQALLAEYDIRKVTVGDIKKWVWNAKGDVMESTQRFQKKCFQLFPPFDNIDVLNKIMQMVTDAWNYFPHKELGGKSPDQMYKEIYGADALDEGGSRPDARNSGSKREMPKVLVGGREMDFDEFEAMIARMEKAQKPFKKWIEKDVLPKYKKYLEQMVGSVKDQEKHYRVADLFFRRVLHIGFVDFDSIRPAFVKDEFPDWWPTHVMDSNLQPAHVRKSLALLFEFTELVYGVGEKFGLKK